MAIFNIFIFLILFFAVLVLAMLLFAVRSVRNFFHIGSRHAHKTDRSETAPQGKEGDVFVSGVDSQQDEKVIGDQIGEYVEYEEVGKEERR